MISQHSATVLPFRRGDRHGALGALAPAISANNLRATSRGSGNVVELASFARRSKRRRAFAMAPYPGGEAA